MFETGMKLKCSTSLESAMWDNGLTESTQVHCYSGQPSCIYIVLQRFHVHKLEYGIEQHHQYEHIPFFHANKTSLFPLFLFKITTFVTI